MFKFGDFDAANNTIVFGEGGFQGARGSNTGGDFFVENIMEELDAPGEFFFRDGKLFYFHNDTAGTAPPAGTLFEATKNDTIIHTVGTQADPVKGLSFKGITFTGTSIQYMQPHGIPSGITPCGPHVTLF